MRKVMVCGLLAFGAWLTTQASPLAGCYSVTPPGGWSERLQGGVPGRTGNEIRASDGATYLFAGAKIAPNGVTTEPPGSEWDYLTKYVGGTLVLSNVPGAPWFTACESAKAFVVSMPEVMVKTRSTRFTGADQGRLEFELSGQSGWISILATYAGMPQYRADGADVVASGTLDSAQVCIGERVAVEVRGDDGSRPAPLNVKSRGVIPVVIYGTKDFDVRTIAPASLRLDCVPVLRWSYEKECNGGTLALVLKFDTQAVVANLPPVRDRQVIPLILTGELKSGEPISGSDEVIILGVSKNPKGR